MWRIFTPERCKNMGKNIDRADIDKAVIDLRNTIMHVLQILRYNKATKPQKLEGELKDTALSIVSKWYASYDPYRYSRTMSLKKAFKITKNGIDVSVDYDPSLIKGHRDDVSVFYNSFIEGYHGGATGEDKAGFSVSVPTWRSPYGYYIHWGDPAPKSFSPRDEIEKETQKLLDQYDEEWEKIVRDDIRNPFMKKYNALKAMCT